ncbi:MAG TPA: response regulator transcription factor [Candidatus Hydrogenedentes bacterium]|nr:response regulator transcription factor [Candidatus Hydrogenedentota bacterium]
MEKHRVLVVEDDEDILELICFNLQKEGFRVDRALTGEDALRMVADGRDLPALILLDLMLPRLSGFEVCRRLKENAATAAIPIIMVTARGEEADVVSGLELGADDYITKPFSPRVLVARVRALMRRKRRGEVRADEVIKIRDIIIHPGRHEVTVAGEPVTLTYTEFALLHLLARRPGWVFTRNQIINAIRGDAYVVTDRTVDVQVTGLRKKLGHAGEYIKTVRGVGYKFDDGGM